MNAVDRLSPRERELFDLVSDRPATSTELIRVAFPQSDPADVRSLFHARMASIMRKCRGAIVKSPRRGPKPITFRRTS